MAPPMPTPPMGMVRMPLHLRAEIGRSVRLAQIRRDRHRLCRSREVNGDDADRSGRNRLLSKT